MKIEDFICPCCGLPNHLEFKNRNDYDTLGDLNEVQEDEFSFDSDGEGNIFKDFIVDSNKVEELRVNLKSRLALIQQYSERFHQNKSPIDYIDWYKHNIVGFINKQEDIEDYTQYMLIPYKIEQHGMILNRNIIEERVKVLLDNFKIDEHIQAILNSLDTEKREHFSLILYDSGELIEHQYQTYTYYSKEGNNARIIRGDNR